MPRGVAWLTGLLLTLAIAPGAAHAAVVLNEVNCEGTDWIELVNTADDAVDLSGWLLTDDPLDGDRADHRLLLAAGTTLAGQGVLVLEKGAGGFPFGVKCGEDTIRLADGGGAPVDEVVVPGLATPTDTWGRYPNGTGDWRATLASRGTPNAPSDGGGGPPADAAAWLFEPGTVVEIDLGLSDEAREELAEEPDEYVPGTFSLTTSGGTYGPFDVGVRLKGSGGSFRPLSGKAAFKVSFNEIVPGQRFLGLRRLTLNNMVQDHSMVHETLAYELFRAAEVPAPRTGHAFVRVNGEAYGVYLNLETLDEVALPRWFATTRHLYEGGYDVDVREDALDAFEVDEGDEDDRDDLAALSAAAGTAPFSASVSAVADLDELTRMWAVERYIGHWDGYGGSSGPNNYYLHSDANGRFSMLPWGTDQTFAERTSFDLGGGRLFSLCVHEPTCRSRYRAALALVRTRVGALDLGGRATAVAAALAPWQALDPRREQRLIDIANAVGGTQTFLAARPLDLEQWLASELPVTPPTPPAPGAPPPNVPSPPAAAAAGTTAGTTSEFRPASLRVGATRVGRTSLTTTVRAPRAGRVTQSARVDSGIRTVTLCTARVSVPAAGSVVVRCRLGRTAQRLRAAGTLRARITTRFAPVAGAAESVTRPLVVRRSPPSAPTRSRR